MSAQQHPQIPWVLWQRTTTGFAVHCRACKASAAAGTPEGVDAFAGAHQQHQSASPTHYGAGDLVARATKAMGLGKPCTPCEARRAALNARFPQLWRR